MYETGEYLAKNPAWHVQDSPWKARQVLRMLQRNGIQPMSICDIGCGAGAVLEHLQRESPPGVELCGYEVSPQAFSFCQKRANDRLHFVLGDVVNCGHGLKQFDLVLMLDVVEHVESHCELLRGVRPLGKFKIFHFPLDLSVQGLIRGIPSKVRRSAGHIHYFTKQLVLQTLEDTSYHVLDYFYTLGSVESESGSVRTQLMRFPRRLLFSITPDGAALFLGGCSLLILAT